VVTAAGKEVARRLIEERRASLARLCAGWVPEENPELAELLIKLAHDLAREPRAHDSAVPVTASV
jgi:DNA-binding MarR family transcriptional regulator